MKVITYMVWYGDILGKHMHARAFGKKQNTETYKCGHAGCGGEHTQMFCDFNHVHGQVISGKHTAFTHAEAPLKTEIDLEE